MKKRIILFTKRIILFTICLSLLSTTFINSYAAAISDMEINVSLTKEFPENDRYDKYEKVYVHIDFQAKELHSGQGFEMDLPEQFDEELPLEFDVLTENNVVAGTCTVIGHKLNVTFNEYVDTIEDIRGKIELARTIKEEYYETNNVELTFECMGKTWIEHIETEALAPDKDEVLFKYGYTDGENDEDLYWELRINHSKNELNDVTITDQLGEGQKLIKNSLVIIKNADFDESGELIKDSPDCEFLDINDLEHEITDDHFWIKLGNIKEAYCILYQVEITKHLDEYDNLATLKSNEVEYDFEASEAFQSGSAEIEGDLKKGSVLLKKVDKYNTSKTLAGAEFQLKDNKGNVIGTYSTNADGIIQVSNLEFGTYTFVETKAPDGYELNSSPLSFTVNDDTLISLEMTNSKSPPEEPDTPKGSVLLKKVDKDDTSKTLAGAEFQLKDNNGNVIGTYSTNADGIIQVSDLEFGTYTFVETKAPNGYELNDITLDFTVNNDTLISLEMTNSKTPPEEPDTPEEPDEPDTPKGSVLLKKVDKNDTSKTLAGAEFQLKDNNGNVIGIYSTNADGIIQVSDLEFGTYTFVETEAPDGYELNDMTLDFTVNNDTLISLEMTNSKTPPEEPDTPEKPDEPDTPKSSVLLKKVDKDDTSKTLAGAEFQLKDNNGNVIGTYSTNADGIIQVSDLEFGTYTFVETKAPDGYELDSLPLRFTLNDDKILFLELTNSKNPPKEHDKPEIPEEPDTPKGSVLLKKIDKDDISKTLSGAKFQLKDNTGNIIGTYSTNADGFIQVSDLEFGTNYTFVEIEAPNGYDLNSSPLNFTLNDDTILFLEVTNSKNPPKEHDTPSKPSRPSRPNTPKGSVVLKKVDKDDTSKTLAGAKFQLKDDSGNVIGTYSTNADGVIQISDLKLGTYTFVEIEAPNDYNLNSSPLKFTLNDSTTLFLEITNSKNPPKAHDTPENTEVPIVQDIPVIPERVDIPIKTMEPKIPGIPNNTEDNKEIDGPIPENEIVNNKKIPQTGGKTMTTTFILLILSGILILKTYKK